MTITNTANSVRYYGNGTTGPFAIGFRFISNSDLIVIKIDAQGIKSTLVEIAHYTVTGSGGYSGSLTLVSALAVDEQLIIVRMVPFTQPIDFRNQGAMQPETVESALDRLTMMALQADALTLKVLPEYLGSTDLPLPVPAGVLAWNSSGDALETVPVVGGVLQAGPWIDVANYASLTEAVAVLGSASVTLLIDSATTVTANTSVPATMNLLITGRGSIATSSATGRTLTIYSGFNAPFKEIFLATPGVLTVVLAVADNPSLAIWGGGLDDFVNASHLGGELPAFYQAAASAVTLDIFGFVPSSVLNLAWVAGAGTTLASSSGGSATSSLVYAKVKEISIYSRVGTVTCSFMLTASIAGTSYARLYVNGVAVGVEINDTPGGAGVSSSTNITITSVPTLIQVYAKVSTGGAVATITAFTVTADSSLLVPLDTVTLA